MADKMTLLTIEAVGQVAAALTRTSPPDEEPAVADLAGDRLAVRSAPADPEFWIPAGELAVVIADRNDAVLVRPRRYRVVDDVPLLIGAKVVSDVVASPGEVKLTLDVQPDQPPHAATGPITAWVLVQDGLTAQPVVVTASVPIDATDVVVPAPVEHGTYQVLAIVAGYQLKTASVDL